MSKQDAASQEEPILQFFFFDHLPLALQRVAEPFYDLAHALVVGGYGIEEEHEGEDVFPVPRNPERSVALRKLLEAKDAAVRARLFVDLAK